MVVETVEKNGHVAVDSETVDAGIESVVGNDVRSDVESDVENVEVQGDEPSELAAVAAQVEA